MDSINSIKGYGKFDHELEQESFWRKTRKRLTIVSISFIVLAAIIGAVVGTVSHKRSNGSSPSSAVPTELTPAASLKAVCSVTQYPSSCFSSISSLDAANTSDPEVLFKLSLHVAMDELAKLRDYPSKLIENSNLDASVKAALGVCEYVFDDAVDMLNDSISSMAVGEGGKILSQSKINDMKTWLSTSITDQETCLDALRELNGTEHFNSKILEDVTARMENSTEFVSNSLAIVARIIGLLTDFNIPIHRKLLGFERTTSGFPSWVSKGDRRLLLESKPTPNVIVAADGSGNYTTIGAAVDAIPTKSKSRFIIYVKEGTYKENIVMDKNKWNVMIYGDGIDKTIISGDKSYGDGVRTFLTATFAVMGKGFMARDIKFMNTAGPEKHQAVAFRSGSDKSVYFRCSFDAYQDTLYAYSNRQFYRDCDITGTIDFIFGNAAVVLQHCRIMPRQPMSNQYNTITAQGRKDHNQNTGISIQKSQISAFGNLTVPTYLGRPWKNCSTTVIMQTDIGPFVNPSGWISWESGVDPPSSIFYGEYQNTGPGSATEKRVQWAGYKPALTESEAGKFAVESFIQGGEWLPPYSVTFEPTL